MWYVLPSTPLQTFPPPYPQPCELSPNLPISLSPSPVSSLQNFPPHPPSLVISLHTFQPPYPEPCELSLKNK